MRLNALVAASLLFSVSAFAAPAKFTKSSGTIEWLGKKNIAGDQHTGTVDLKEGSLDLAAKKGEFVIDMKTIKPTDAGMKDKDKAKLAGHLSSSDFFDVSKHPEAKIVVKDIVKDPAAKDKYTVSGDLNVRGTTKPITFPATIVDNGKSTSIDTQFAFKRSEYGITYKSEAEVKKEGLAEKAKAAAQKAVKAAGDAWIEDDIQLSIKLKS